MKRSWILIFLVLALLAGPTGCQMMSLVRTSSAAPM